MNIEQAILAKVRCLPAKQQQEVLDFAEALIHKAQAAVDNTPVDWENDPFVGMWKDREDMADSIEWVRQLRQREWKRLND